MAFFPLNDGSDIIESSYPYDELMDLLIKKTAEVGHMLTPEEAHADPKFIDPNCYAFTLGGRFSDWAKDAWQTLENEQEEDMRKIYTREKIIELVRKFYEEHKRLPTAFELNNNSGDLPPYNNVLKELGGKPNWLKAIYGDKEPPFEGKTLDTSVAAPQGEQTPQEELARSQKDVTPQGNRALQNGAIAQGFTPKVEIIAPPEQGASSDSATIIELKISLPDREAPIGLRISF